MAEQGPSGSAEHDHIPSAQAPRDDYDSSQEPRLSMDFLEDFYRKATMGGPPPPQYAPQYHVSYTYQHL